MNRLASWFCTKTCVVCGKQFTSRSGATRRCDSCRALPCPQCGKPVKHWSKGVCDSCNMRNRYYAMSAKERAAYSRDYYHRNRELVKAKWANYRRMHPDVIKAGTARYIAENRDEIQRRDKDRREIIRLQVVDAYGGKCECCGETEPKFLCIHHVNGDGKVDRANGYGGVSLFAKLRREGWPKDRYRLLCHNCNNALRIFGFCPHQGASLLEVVNANMR